MKKNYIILSLSLLFTVLSFAQTDIERRKIKENYDTEKLEALIQNLKNKNIAKEKRVSAYLNANTNLKRKIVVDGKSYVIYDVQNGKPILRTTHNLKSAIGTRTNKLQTGGSLGLNLDGQNMFIGVWDEESALGTHNEFKDNQTVPQSRVVYPEFNGGPFIGTTSAHATHVAGTLIAKGVDSDAKGMAPEASLRSFDWFNDDAEAATEASNGLLLSNHSYGIAITDAATVGAYVSDARVWDQVAYTAPYYLPVMSAGNDGTTTYTGGRASGYDKLTGNKTSKNSLIVANANPFLIGGGPNYLLNINSGSSQGPTDDNRIKPDIAGDGTNVYSSTNANDSDYSTFSGTSMASPNVSGSCLLLQQYYNQLNSNYMRASTLKALICHTAIDDSRTGPDPIYGWGFLDTEASANLIKDDSDGTALISEILLNNGESYTYQFSVESESELRATICWTDPAGNSSSSPNNVLTPRLVNDLDLRLEHANSTEFFPWKLDASNVASPAVKGDNFVDNIERIDVSSPTNGNYTLTVTHKGNLTNDSQVFSLILTGSNITLSSKKNTISKLKVWPVPATTKLNIDYRKLTEVSKMKLYNINGSLIYEGILPPNSIENFTFDTSNLIKGIYFLNIESGNSKFSKKIIIK
ncbi:hypothetical protein PK35_13830 [Tamlana nanhaiensis]|uniref:Peptidase S8 n=1 Tax=Neotamlana nanhaiensis TaxID=1382798 RepID=A0A0D7VXC0_9FLAO|nr:S8 family serine peptidase [Tamlana nanhaiensis]KJD31491.1 hypothetical protein PK35_13830 [Tamlana nanhaiensis]